MKKLQITLAILSFMTAVGLFTSCNKQKISQEEQKEIGIQYSDIAISQNNKFSDNSIYIEYPMRGEKAFLDSVRLWIDTVLCNNPFAEEGKFAVFSGNHDSLNALANYYLSHKIAEVKDKNEIQHLKEMQMKYECYDSVFAVFKGEQLTSYAYNCYVFLGGAHGGTSFVTATFNNKTGEILTWDIITNKDTLQTMIRTGLMQYFEVETIQDMQDMLILDDITNIPLPVAKPYFTEKGLMLCYGQYEIASYAAGMPCVVIPWDKCSAILSQDIMAILATDIHKHSTNVSKTK